MIWPMLFVLICWLMFMAFVHVNLSFDNSQGVDLEYPFGVEEIDIIVAARNEEQNIGAFIQSIESQVWLPDRCNLLIVDDHSIDHTVDKVRSRKIQNDRVKVSLFNLSQGYGKKAALRFALSKTRSKYVVQLDADCILSENALGVMLKHLLEGKQHAVFGEVWLDSKNIASKMMALENLNNQCVTEAFFNINRPVMANGAIIALTQDVVDLYSDSLNSTVSSGDDVFFIQALREHGHKMAYARNATVTTSAPMSMVEFAAQRLRWASKTSDLKFWDIKALALFVWMVQFLLLVFLVLGFVSGNLFWVLAIWVTKWVIEYSFQRYWFEKRNMSMSPLMSILLSVIYPIYIVVIGFLSILNIRFEWKGRIVKTTQVQPDRSQILH